MDKEEIINKIQLYSRLLQQYFELDSVFLFGSYANDEATEDSDIDVAIVVNQVHGDYFSYVPLLWKLRRQVDVRIEPILFEKDHDPSGFLSEIKRTGIQINIP